ncbi:MAG: hypothetical protein KA139_02125 [Rhodobacteraceae bacterium]|nr:hypothetical protein [Paracoccaceae bacterium]
MPPIRVALIADDLTGALDAAAPFVAQGLAAVVATAPGGLARAIEAGAPVVAVSLGSREVPQVEAAARAAAAARQLVGAEWLFKKIDSRLKGHVAAELAAVAAARGGTRVLLCPAIPAMGRVVRGGAVEGFGVAEPIALAPVAAAVAAAGGLQVAMPDTLSEGDLDRAVAGLDPATLLAGARGLAAALARRLGAGQVPPPPARLPGPVALAIGSRDPITLAQVAALRAARPGLAVTLAPDGASPAFAGRADTLLLASPGPGADGATVSARLAAAFCRDHLAGRAALVLTGGETASAVLAAMAVQVLALLGEVGEGLPLSRPLDFPDAPLIVTKSGGFGASDALVRLMPQETRQE